MEQSEQPSKTAAEISKDGSFNRQRSRFTTPFGNQPGELPVEAARYRLVWTAACPWAHRV
jgi:putative glutathione S-transferase